MARIRSIKPSFFKSYKLYCAEQESGFPLRMAFAGLWTVADREGRFQWIPEELKIDCLPHDKVDFSRVLDALWTRGYIDKYEVNGHVYGVIPTFQDHQVINNRESPSVLPEPNENNTLTRAAPVAHAKVTPLKHALVEGKGREGKGKETRVADALPDWLDKTAWEEWVQCRREQGKPLKPTTIRKQLKFLEQHKADHAEILGNAVRGGWQGLFPLRKDPVKETPLFRLSDAELMRKATAANIDTRGKSRDQLIAAINDRSKAA